MLAAQGHRLGLLALAGALALAACRLLEGRVEGFNVYDEWLPLVEGMRWLQGELPYREFAPTYGPAEPAWVALFAWDGSPQLLALRALRGLGVAGLTVVAAACLWRHGSRLGPPLLAILIFTEAGSFTSPALACVFGALLLFDVARQGDGRVRACALVGAGTAAGIAGTFRLELGATLVGVGLVSVFAFPRPARLRAAGLFLAGGLPLALGYLGLIVAGGGEPFLRHLREMRACLPGRALPYPFPPAADLGAGAWLSSAFSAGLPPAVALVAPCVYGWRLARSRRGQGPAPSLLFGQLVLLLLLALPYASWRPDEPHRFPAYVYAACLLCLLLPPLEARLDPRRRRQALRGLLGVLVFLVCVRVSLALQDQRRVPSALRGLSGILNDPDDEARWRETVAQVERHAPPDAPLYVGLDDHARVFINDVMVYVLAGRPVAVRSHHLLPVVATTAAFQRELDAQLEREQVPVIVLARHLWREEPNASRERGSDLLDRAIGRRYGLAYGNRDHVVLVRLPE